MTMNLGIEKNYEYVVKHTSKDFCGGLLAPCWEIKEGGECEPGVYPHINLLTYCGLESPMIHGCLSGHDPNVPDCFIHKFPAV